MQCFCGNSKDYSQCCEPLILGKVPSSSPEQLMRSRFSAFCQNNMDYIKQTTHPQAEMDWKANEDWAKNVKFKKLEVIKSDDEGNKGMVEFKAYFEFNNEEHCHHEVSRFRKHQGQWFYRDGRIIDKA